MKLPLSNRLLACCDFVRPGDRVADVGCDHGYLGIHLLQTGRAKSIIASDINENPLLAATRNSRKYGTAKKMTFYLSPGVQKIPRDFDCMVCAGMGADTMISILDAAPWLKDTRYHMVLQCQSKRPELRKYLNENGFSISRETLAQDGKFIYPIWDVIYAPGDTLAPWEYYISPALESCGSPLLPAFRQRVMEGLEKTVNGLAISGGEKYEAFKEILNHLIKSEGSEQA